MACLQVLKGMNPGQVFPLDDDQFILGRHPDCDIVLDVGAVSRQHARIIREAGEFYVEDLHSRNGTIVNGNLIDTRHRLQENDRVKICDLLFTFHRNQPGDPSARETAIGSGIESSIDLFVEEESAEDDSSSTVMSKLDLSQSDSGLRMAVRPEAKLRALVEISQNLGNTLSLEAVLPKLLDSLFKIFIQADRGLIVLRESPTGPLLLKAVKHRRPDAEDTVRVSRTIVNQAMNSKEAILSADAASDSRFDMSQSIADFRIRSLICAPLIDSDGTALGIIQIDSVDQRSRFRQDDLEVLASVARQAAIVIENAKLHETAMRQQRIERDLEIAHQVQKNLLPAEPPQIAGYQFFDYYEAASELGGDYYDYVELPNQRLAVVIADVAGKGIPAALLVARFSADVRYWLVSEPDLAKAVTRLNAQVAANGWQDRFITCGVLVLDHVNHRVNVVNAGHLPLLYRRATGKVERFGDEVAGIPLGIDGNFEYESASLTMAAGEMLALYTDGLTEAMNAAGELYGIDRLEAEFAVPAPSLPLVARHLLDGVQQFVGRRPQADDICLVAFSRLPV